MGKFCLQIHFFRFALNCAGSNLYAKHGDKNFSCSLFVPIMEIETFCYVEENVGIFHYFVAIVPLLKINRSENLIHGLKFIKQCMWKGFVCKNSFGVECRG